MTKKTVTREMLDKFCDTDGMLILRATCHPDAGFAVHYVAMVGNLVINCAACGKHIDSVAVAPARAAMRARAKAIQQ